MSLKRKATIGILSFAGLAGCATDQDADEAARQQAAMHEEAPAIAAAWKASHMEDGVFVVKSDEPETAYSCRDYWANAYWWGTMGTWSNCFDDGTGILTYQVCTWLSGCESQWSEPVSCTCVS